MYPIIPNIMARKKAKKRLYGSFTTIGNVERLHSPDSLREEKKKEADKQTRPTCLPEALIDSFFS